MKKKLLIALLGVAMVIGTMSTALAVCFYKYVWYCDAYGNCAWIYKYICF